MSYKLNFESEPWKDSAELDDSQELYDEDEAELLDTELYDEVLDERGRLHFVRRPVRPRRPVTRHIGPRRPHRHARPLINQRPLRRHHHFSGRLDGVRPLISERPFRHRRLTRPARPIIRRRILPVGFRRRLIEPIVDIYNSPFDVSDFPVDVPDFSADAPDAPADTPVVLADAPDASDASAGASDAPADAADSTSGELDYENFRPIAVESPGGGRIQNKTDPSPGDIERVIGVGGKTIALHRHAAAAWKALVEAARADGIAKPLLLIVSGYRSSARQKQLWEAALRKYGSREQARKWVAPPGGSAHQSGRAIDFHLGGKNSSANVAQLRTLPAYKWLAANARRFGFYPYSAEPWHWEYNPRAGSRELELDPELYGELELWNEQDEEEENAYFSFDELELDGQYEDEEADIYSEITPGKPSTASPTIAKAGATTGSSLAALGSLISPATAATPENALSIMKIICQFSSIPWQVGYTILEHEGGVRLFNHHDGVMQTTADARKATIPLIPRPLKLALLSLPSTDKTADATLTSKLYTEFPRRLAVQIATGVQELNTNLQRFSGYVALAFIAYNAGPGWASYIATQGKFKKRPPTTSDATWEKLCRAGAALLHQSPSSLLIGKGAWQCDKNLGSTGGWFKTFGVTDPTTKLQLIAYQYLRSIKTCINSKKPTVPCNAQNHTKREPGSGPEVCDATRYGALDKLFDPMKLGAAYRQAAGKGLVAISDDGSPLKVVNGSLIKITSGAGPKTAGTSASKQAPVISPLATYLRGLRKGGKRNLPVYGITVHTTGSGPAIKAQKNPGKSSLDVALDVYLKQSGGFPHYIIGYDGAIIATCDEQEIAWHVGWNFGRKGWTSQTIPTWWSKVWNAKKISNPGDLLPPQANVPNQVYIGIELLADTSGYGFTNAQYDSLAKLIVDLTRRHKLPISSAPSPRLLGHEDLDPIARNSKGGPWDPGAHRATPKFDWARLWALVTKFSKP
jgi:D-alanyl-D-alanine carboxypeptidase/N-acetylmuramoyl-L-alanine amidase